MPTPLWQKGQSGNPGGRPKDPTKDLARKYTKRAILTLRDIMLSEDSHDKDKIKAAEILLNRGWGKPTESVELTGADGGPLEILQHVDAPPQETREEWIARIERERAELEH